MSVTPQSYYSGNTGIIGFTFLYDKYAAILYGIISEFLNHPVLANQCLEQVFNEIWDRLPSQEDRGKSLFPWMMRITGKHLRLSIDEKKYQEQRQLLMSKYFSNKILSVVKPASLLDMLKFPKLSYLELPTIPPSMPILPLYFKANLQKFLL